MLSKFTLFVEEVVIFLKLKKYCVFMVVALSTGSCYDLGFNQHQAIEFVKNYSSLNGIELVFANPKEPFK